MGRWLNQFIQGLGPWGVPVVAAAALLEYVFPPFPGDTVTVFAAWLAVTGELHWAVVWAAVTGGSMAGMALDWGLGRWLGFGAARRLPEDAERPWWNPMSQERLVRFQRRYQRWGDWLILANRFVPALRAVFFVAAGASGLSLFRVLVLGTVSAGLWNGLLLLLGYEVGDNLDELQRLTGRVGTVTWWILGGGAALVVVGLVIRRWLRRRSPRHRR